MAIIKLCALETLAEQITAQIPELVDRVCVGVPPNSHDETTPSMTVNAVRWKYEPGMVEELTTAPGVSVRRVGHHEGMIQIRILAATPGERDDLADRVVDVFLGFVDPEGFAHPGTILSRITNCGLVPWVASWDLDQDELVNLEAFTSKYEALIQVEGRVPALVTRTGVRDVRTLILGLTADFTATANTATMAAPATEVVQISETGAIEPYTP